MRNNGPDSATGVRVSVTFSGADTSVTAASSAQGTCTVSATHKSFSCPLGTVASGQQLSIEAAALPGKRGQLLAAATVSAKQTDSDASSNQAQADVRVREADPPVDPEVGGHALDSPYQEQRSFAISWKANESGSGIASYDVRFRAASPQAGFGRYVTWQQATVARRTEFRGAGGTTYCFSVRATDRDGNTSDWSAERCTSILLEPTALVRHGPWSLARRGGGPVYGVRSSTPHTRLTFGGAAARRVAVLVAVCPACGVIDVSWNGRVVRTVNLTASVREKRLLTVMTFPRLVRGRLGLEVESARGAVTIEGVGLGKL
jgi:hypothetical protein